LQFSRQYKKKHLIYLCSKHTKICFWLCNYLICTAMCCSKLCCDS